MLLLIEADSQDLTPIWVCAVPLRFLPELGTLKIKGLKADLTGNDHNIMYLDEVIPVLKHTESQLLHRVSSSNKNKV